MSDIEMEAYYAEKGLREQEDMERESFRRELADDYADTEELTMKAEALRDAIREDGGIAAYEAEQDRNLSHAQDNQI